MQNIKPGSVLRPSPKTKQENLFAMTQHRRPEVMLDLSECIHPKKLNVHDQMDGDQLRIQQESHALAGKCLYQRMPPIFCLKWNRVISYPKSDPV